MLPPLAGIDGSQPPPTGHADDELYGSSVDVMAGVGELVRSTTGQWMVKPPLHYPRGHPLGPGRMLVGSIACSCGRHLTWRCDCGAVTYGPPLGAGCSLLDGPSRVRG
jgi:hypothetical protein